MAGRSAADYFFFFPFFPGSQRGGGGGLARVGFAFGERKAVEKQIRGIGGDGKERRGALDNGSSIRTFLPFLLCPGQLYSCEDTALPLLDVSRRLVEHLCVCVCVCVGGCVCVCARACV